jgi:hypothetical protein
MNKRTSTSKTTPTVGLRGRTDFVHPTARVTYEQRLHASGAVDLRRNHRTCVTRSGFVDIVPVDSSKRW